MTRRSTTLLCWHSDRAGADVLVNAIDGLRKQHGVLIDEVIYLVQRDRRGTPPVLPGVDVKPVVVDVRDPTRHRDLYDVVRRVLQEHVAGPVHVNVSPGTPAMHAVWLALQLAGALPARSRLWSSQKPDAGAARVDPVDFELSTYLREIRKVQAARPEVAHYDLEATSPARRSAFERLRRFVQVPGAPVLVLGERGVGKSRLVEETIGALKQRKVVAVACDSLESDLADSILFGHTKGAFTGAVANRDGLIKLSHKKVLFLDEVQDLPSTTQRRLVRFLQDRRGRFRPLGADKEDEADVDLICASNLPVAELRTRLDADLFDRVSHLTVEIPPLRQCREDLGLDWQRVWREVRGDAALPATAPSSGTLRDVLARHDLPGNLRDLQRLAYLLIAFLPDARAEEAVAAALTEWSRPEPPPKAATIGFGEGTRNERIARFERELARWAYAKWGTWKRAASELECDEKTLRRDAELE